MVEEKCIDILIELELNISKMYVLFSETFSDDYEFWFELANEELNHASLLETTKEILRVKIFTTNSLFDNINETIDLIDKFEDIINEFLIEPTKSKAFEIALRLESSAGEIHFQQFIGSTVDDEVVSILKQLNSDDIYHYKRILDYSKLN